jgi:chromosomal replication initiation ATPase DnaA
MNHQYHLPLPYHEAMTENDFMVTASNREAVAWALERAPSSWPHHCLILYGPPGCGKTHLLSVWAEKNAARRIEAGEDVIANVLGRTESPPPLEGGVRGGVCKVDPPPAKTNDLLTQAKVFASSPSRGEDHWQALVLDDADKIAGNAAHEEWLQHLYNAAQAAKTPLLLTASTPPPSWGLKLKDIESRLKSCPAIAMKEPDDELMRGMLLKLFADRQLLVESDVIDFLVPRIERTGTAVRQTIGLLDKQALEQGRKITVPFVSGVLG